MEFSARYSRHSKVIGKWKSGDPESFCGVRRPDVLFGKAMDINIQHSCINNSRELVSLFSMFETCFNVGLIFSEM